ncbi:MFS transporter [Lysinibacter cavernae]|uniref:Putative MFS transporter n=1 Tax=Lysinibacter cavernae TaxID=1640652 RepID=A0A7X5TTM7_9MICO|nr:putative MFS transporter [Lysinibacter cavernae]
MTQTPAHHGAAGPTQTRRQRLDALPFTKKHRQLLVGSGAGWALDAMDVGLISYIVAALTVQWALTPGEASWIVSAGFIGMAVGAALGGMLADRLGRRTVFAITLIVFGVATGLAAFAWSVGTLIALRVFIGLGLGAELPVASTLVSEFAPSRIRGRVIVILEAFWAVGWTLAAIIGFLVVPSSEIGWRVALLVGAVPAVFAAVVRFRLPESVSFLESRGRFAEAEATVRQFEESAGVPSPADAPLADEQPTDGIQPAALGARARFFGLWAAPHRRNTAALWTVWFCVNFAYYGAFIWIPSLLVAAGFDLVRSFGYTLIITLAQLPGYAVSAWLIEAWGRRSTLATFLVGSAVSAFFFGTASDTTQIIAWGMLLSFFNLGAWGALYAVTPELYPSVLRGTGAGWAAGFGRVASIVAPLLVPLIRELGGTSLLFGIFAAFFAVATVGALLLAEKRGRALDDDAAVGLPVRT